MTMKTLKYFLVAVMALTISGRAHAQLSAANGLAAGQSLLALYSQYKADGKLDLANTANITNIINLITNVKGLTAKSTAENTSSSFLSNLISGSKNLVTNSNSNSVLGTLGSIANLDTSSLASSLASSAATSAISGLFGKKNSSSASSNTSASAVTAASALTSLFSSLKK